MRRSSEEKNSPPDPLLQVVFVTKADGRTRTYAVTIGSSAIAVAIMFLGSHTWTVQEGIRILVKFLAPH